MLYLYSRYDWLVSIRQLPRFGEMEFCIEITMSSLFLLGVAIARLAELWPWLMWADELNVCINKFPAIMFCREICLENTILGIRFLLELIGCILNFWFQAHSGCHKSLHVECDFGALRKIFLPPYCVTVPRLEFSIETILSFNRSSAPGTSTAALAYISVWIRPESLLVMSFRLNHYSAACPAFPINSSSHV